MKKLIAFLLLLPMMSQAQFSFRATIRNEASGNPVPGAIVHIKNLGLNLFSNDSGFVIIDHIEAGRYELSITATGFNAGEQVIHIPLKDTGVVDYFLKPLAGDLEEVMVISVRSNRSFNNTATRVEVLGQEEIHEEATMRPGDIRMMLAESTGIQVQQTSATSASAGIRIQGLDGRYTQILKDGFPVYAGAATGLGLLQTPPLDLQQVEVIKGSSSTLYGAGAISGLVNLITKIPENKRVLNFHLNVTSAGGLDLNSFLSRRSGKFGFTCFVSNNSNKAYDPAGIHFSAIPKFERFTFNPKLFLYFSEKTTLNFGINSTFENRLGGDMYYIKGEGDSNHRFYEQNKTKRISTQLTFDHKVSQSASFKFKNSVSFYHRLIQSGGYIFDGTQYSTFTEATFVKNHERIGWVAGLSLFTDRFEEKDQVQIPLRNYDQSTWGVFVQNNLNSMGRISLETGLRADMIKNYGFVFLPKVSLLWKLLPKLTIRMGTGFGYKSPSIFTEESEKILFKNVLAVNPEVNRMEKSFGVNGDINFKTSFENISFSLNQFFFYTSLAHPLFLFPASGNFYNLQNIPGSIDTKGAETNIKLSREEISLYLGYTFTDGAVKNNGTHKGLSLTPKHRFNSALVYEIEGKWKFGSELYYFGRQERSDGSIGNDYWLAGFVAEKIWKKCSLFINFENIGDVRQTKFENIYTGPVNAPAFKDIYAPLEGFVVNGGLRLNL